MNVLNKLNINAFMGKNIRQYVKPEARIINVYVEKDMLATSTFPEEIRIEDKGIYIDEEDEIL